MSDDTVVIPLRVSREQRRVWRVEAGKNDQSVQKWILEKLVPGRARMNSEVTGKSERDRQMEEIPPATVNPSISAEPIRDRCARCGDTVLASEIVREPRTGRKLCPDCVENIKNGQA